MIARISAPPPSGRSPGGRWSSVWSQKPADGLRFIWNSAVLRDLIGVYASAAVFAAGAIALSYALALQRYNAGRPGSRCWMRR